MKKWFAFLLSALMLFGCPISAQAAQEKIVDKAELLTYGEAEMLSEKATALTEEYGMDVVILTVPDLGGKSAQTYADSYYDDHGYGIGSQRSGILLLLAMEEREWYMSTCGEAIDVFTDSGLDALGERILPDLSGGDYYGAFDLWLELLPDYFEASLTGAPLYGGGSTVNYPEPEVQRSVNIFISLAIGLVVAAVTVLIMRGTMNTARRKSGAAEYMRKGSYHLTVHQDLFLYSNITKTPIPKSNGSSGGRSCGHGGRGGSF